MKNNCDICHKDFPVLVQAFIYDKNFAKGATAVVETVRVCKADLAKLQGYPHHPFFIISITRTKRG